MILHAYPNDDRTFVCEACGGDGGWGPEQPGQTWLRCTDCDGDGFVLLTGEPIEEEDLWESEG